MTTPTEQDLLDAIEAFLPRPKLKGEYTSKEIATEKGTSEGRALKALNAMIAEGKAAVRDSIAGNGKPVKYYRLVV